MQYGLHQHLRFYPGQGNRISAQAHLQKFYSAFGYTAVSEPYLEDGIPHVEMLTVLRI
jgi:ElaA protein